MKSSATQPSSEHAAPSVPAASSSWRRTIIETAALLVFIVLAASFL